MVENQLNPDTQPVFLTAKEVGLRENAEPPEFAGVYAGSKFAEMLQAQDSAGRLRAALFSDVDWTFYRHDRPQKSIELFDSLAAENYPIALVTGNDFTLMKKRFESGMHPYVPIVIGSAGTEVWVLHEEASANIYKKDADYEQKMLAHYDREKLGVEADELVEELRNSHPEWSFNYQRLDSDEETKAAGADKAPDFQPYKISFYAYATSVDEADGIRNFMEERFPEQKIIVCEESNYNSKLPPNEVRKKYCVDILPATKGDAVDYVSNMTGLYLKVVAGDNQNDLDMISRGDVSVLVGGTNTGVMIAINKVTPAAGQNRHFQKIKDEQGNLKRLVYREQGNEKGPESISKAVRHLQNALRISRKIKSRQVA